MYQYTKRQYLELLGALLVLACFAGFGYILFFSGNPGEPITFEDEMTVSGVVTGIYPNEKAIVVSTEKGVEQWLYMELETVIVQPLKVVQTDGTVRYYRTEIVPSQVPIGARAKALFRNDVGGEFPVLAEIVLNEKISGEAPHAPAMSTSTDTSSVNNL